MFSRMPPPPPWCPAREPGPRGRQTRSRTRGMSFSTTMKQRTPARRTALWAPAFCRLLSRGLGGSSQGRCEITGKDRSTDSPSRRRTDLLSGILLVPRPGTGMSRLAPSVLEAWWCPDTGSRPVRTTPARAEGCGLKRTRCPASDPLPCPRSSAGLRSIGQHDTERPYHLQTGETSALPASHSAPFPPSPSVLGNQPPAPKPAGKSRVPEAGGRGLRTG